MLIREPAVAGSFYPGDRSGCLALLNDCERVANENQETPAVGRIAGGVVPHAGWICSGAVAAGVFEAISSQRQPAVAIVFGAIHVPARESQAYLFPSGAWRTPLGDVPVNEPVGERICERSALVTCEAAIHAREHSIEVEVPFLQHLLPQTQIVPIMVPVVEEAAQMGVAAAQACRDFGIDAIFLASTDLTHYGPSYRFMPHGVGPEGLAWAKEVNDRRMIDLMLAMREGDVVAEARANQNACGPGAVAATIAACRTYGAGRASLLQHTTSYEVLKERYQEPARDAVGYAGVIFHE